MKILCCRRRNWNCKFLIQRTTRVSNKWHRYQALKRKGVLHQYEAEDEPTRPILDRELSTAIDSLQSSTAAIEAQCKVLEAQRDALMALKALDKPNLSVEHMRNERRRKEHQEKSRLDIAVNSLPCTISRSILN